MPTILAEPYDQLSTWIQSIADLMEAVGENFGKNFEAETSESFPALTWRGMSYGKNTRLDVQQHNYHVDRVPVALWGPDDRTLVGLGAMIDDAAELLLSPPEDGATTLESEHFKFHYFRREGDWQLIDWTGVQTREGRILKQYTADFSYCYLLHEDGPPAFMLTVNQLRAILGLNPI